MFRRIVIEGQKRVPILDLSYGWVGIWEKSVASDCVVKIEGDPWFVAKDVAHVLGYVPTETAIRDHCRSAQRMTGPN